MMQKISTTMGEDTYEKLREYCHVTEVPMARVIERAVKDYLEKKAKGE